jgi:hypothetical protein
MSWVSDYEKAIAAYLKAHPLEECTTAAITQAVLKRKPTKNEVCCISRALVRLAYERRVERAFPFKTPLGAICSEKICWRALDAE